MANYPAEVSVTAPISPAIERVRLVLFRPFDLGKWFAIGFCAFLADLGQGGGSGHSGGTASHTSSGTQSPVNTNFAQIRTFLHDNLSWIVPVSIALVVIILALCVLFLWLQSRGAFMFLHCVALNRGEVAIPWRKFAAEAHSLWLFKLCLGALGLALTVPFIAWMLWIFFSLSAHQRLFDPRLIPLFIEVGFGWFCLCLPIWIASGITRQFVVPIMYLRGGACMEAWRVLLPVLGANLGRFILYLLFQIVIVIVIGFLLIAFILFTCCIGGLLLVIPYIGSVVLLPVTVFWRSYTLYYLAQYGPEFDVFRAGEAPGADPIAAS